MLKILAAERQIDDWDRHSRLLSKLHNNNCVRAADWLPPAAFNLHPRRAERVAPIGAVQTSGAFHRSMCEALSKDPA